ncbi:MAG: hypothetical protein Q9215_004718 [Flavoplaca cf. flavocitrina]
MAPKRKNKKAASNPARGFATTSTASKAKVPPDESFGSTAVDNSQAQPLADEAPSGDDPHVAKGLHELSPEELERQLEESDLQLFVEKHLDKIRRDVSRQVSRLQTEKRLLRPQAEHLSIKSWLPPDVMELIVQNLGAEQLSYHPGNASRDLSNAEALSEDDLCIRIWTLQEVLTKLGFPNDRCQEALQNILNVAQGIPMRESLAVKDYIWGLDWCLDWLAMHCEAQAMPSYDKDRVGNNATIVPMRHHLTDANDEVLDFNKANPRNVPETTSSSPRDRSDTRNGGHNPGEVTLSPDYDTESDTDPETMTDRYVTLNTQLYTLQPDLSNEVVRGPAKARVASRAAPAQKPTTEIARILQKLDRLKADILFDQHEAEQAWIQMRNKLSQAAAERKRLHLQDDEYASDMQSNQNQVASDSTNQPSESSEDSEEDGGVEALGDFFSGLPETHPSDVNGHLIPNADGKESDRQAVILRDFGKWSGVNPRRTFEEACKARDTSVRITYKLIDRSPFSKQHSLSIQWSRNQPPPLDSPTKTIMCKGDERNVRIKMIAEAVPDAAQSEAYVSSAALFFVFSPVPKEEKAYLRLPPVWKDFWVSLSTLKKNNDLATDREELRKIRSLIDDSARKQGNLEQATRPAEITPLCSKPEASLIGEYHNRMSPTTQDTEEMKSIWTSKSATPSFRNMVRQRKSLPIWGFKEEIIRTVLDHQTVIVCGETGCGKSTQVPSFILEHELSLGKTCKVYCTEPRRISAISLARRVSEELGERKSDVGTSRSLVGYAIRLESKVVRENRLVYATTGIVMRMLEASDDLQEITHLVLDEVHERSIESDFLLIVLRKLLVRRPQLKVILMSATVDAAKFSSYFSGAPVLTVPGRTFPVQTRYLEDAIEETNFFNRDFLRGVPSIDDDEDEAQDSSSDKEKKTGLIGLENYSAKTRSTLAQLDEYRINYDLIVSLLESIATKPTFVNFSKAVLVFLPGIAEIRRLHDMLSGHTYFSNGWSIHPLHSTIAMDEQERAFAIPPRGHRKIVLATNIAETGVTIPDVTCVIDTGKHKEMRFDERRQLSRLLEVFISRANAKQRRGRAGRVQEGLCFHLFTKSRHDTVMAPDQTPEILRLSLQDLVLRVKICKLGAIEPTLAEALDPPLAKNIRRAIDALVDVKALTAAEELTPLGRQLAKLPLDVFLGKVILLGCIFKCLDGAVTIAAILSSKSPFSAPMGARSQADQARLGFKRGMMDLLTKRFWQQRSSTATGDSDLLTVYTAYSAWRRVCKSGGASEQLFCRKNFLLQQNLTNIEELKAQLTTCLVEAKFIALEDGEKSALNKWVSNGGRDDNMYSGMIIIDGNRVRFSVDDWKVMLAIKTLRQKLRQVTAQSFRDPGRQLSPQQQSWLIIWEKMVDYHENGKANGDLHGMGS